MYVYLASLRIIIKDNAVNIPLYFIRLKISTLDQEHEIRCLLRYRSSQLCRCLHSE